jgi:hypothetical protein
MSTTTLAAGNPGHALASAVSGNNTPFTGKTFTPYHPVAERTEKLTVEKAGSTLSFKADSKRAHLVSSFDVHFQICIRTKPVAEFQAALQAKSAELYNSTQEHTEKTRDPFWGLQNVKLVPDLARNIFQKVEMVHNTTTVSDEKRAPLDLLAAMQYENGAESDFYHQLNNGYLLGMEGHGKYGAQTIYFDELYDKRYREINPTNGDITALVPDKSFLYGITSTPLSFGRIDQRPASDPYIYTERPMDDLLRKPGSLIAVNPIGLPHRFWRYMSSPTAGQPDVPDGTGYTVFEPLISTVFPDQIMVIDKRHRNGPTFGRDSLAQKYRKDLCWEIAFRDISRRNVLITTQASGIPGHPAYIPDPDNPVAWKTEENIANIWGNREFKINVVYRLQTPWHRSPAHVFPLLNALNDPKFILTLNDPTLWVQNWKEVQHLIEKPYLVEGSWGEARMKCFDIAKPLWDRMFALNEQRSYLTHDIRTIELPQVPANVTEVSCDGNALALSLKGADWNASIKDLDKLCRMICVEVGIGKWNDDPTLRGVVPPGLDLFESVHMTVADDILNKHKTDHRYMQYFKDFQQKFKRDHNSVHEMWCMPFGIDADIDNHGGGHIDFSPIFNATKLHITFNKQKVAYYASELAPIYGKLKDADELLLTSRPSNQNALWYGNAFQNIHGSLNGAINVVRDVANDEYKYSIDDLYIRVHCFGLQVIIFQGGQLYRQKQT